MVTILFLSFLRSLLGAIREPHRALWVWKAESILADSTRTASFFDFISAPKGEPKARISVIFLSLDIENHDLQPKLISFLTKAHERSLRVDYLCGDAHYAMPEHFGDGLAQLRQVEAFNHRVSKGARFDGIQFDVEPYALPGWPNAPILNGYLSFLEKCHSTIAQLGNKLALGAAIPRWFDGADLHELNKSVLDRVDYVAVMDYVNRSESFISDAKSTVRYASVKGKDVWLGAEVSELPNEKSATFFELGNEKMEETFQSAERAFGNLRCFAGVAVEWYEPYLQLKEK